MPFPIHRYRRLRQSEGLLKMVRETSLSTNDLIEPFFVCEGSGVRQEISSMPGVCRLSIENLVSEVKAGYSLGIPAVILFGIPDKKDDLGSEAYNPDGVVQRANHEIKNVVAEVVVKTDVCIEEYTEHGPCGLVDCNKILNLSKEEEKDPNIEKRTPYRTNKEHIQEFIGFLKSCGGFRVC